MFRVLGLEPSDRHDLKELLLDCVHPEERRTTEDLLATFCIRPGPLRMEVRVFGLMEQRGGSSFLAG